MERVRPDADLLPEYDRVRELYRGRAGGRWFTVTREAMDEGIDEWLRDAGHPEGIAAGRGSGGVPREAYEGAYLSARHEWLQIARLYGDQGREPAAGEPLQFEE